MVLDPQPPVTSVIPPAKLTVPAPFKFGVDARLNGRRTEFKTSNSSAGSSSSSSSSSSLLSSASTETRVRPVPDFAALQASHAASVAAQKAAHAHGPTVPMAFRFRLNTRVKQREAFEEGRRQREAELERQAREEKKAREADEERAYREARRNAVPKANAIPDWYRGVPRRHKD
jgi:hypothetical protein